jgi:predicted naringenin-chalcone synthase
MSSASVLFSFETLLQEGVVREGDVGVMIAMGPGTQIETALVAW